MNRVVKLVAMINSSKYSLVLIVGLLSALSCSQLAEDCVYTVCPDPITVNDHLAKGYARVPADSEGVIDLEMQVSDTTYWVRLWEKKNVPYIYCKRIPFDPDKDDFDYVISHSFRKTIVFERCDMDRNWDNVVIGDGAGRIRFVNYRYGKLEFCYRAN